MNERLELLDAISDLLPASDAIDRVNLVNAIEDLIKARTRDATSDRKPPSLQDSEV